MLQDKIREELDRAAKFAQSAVIQLTQFPGPEMNATDRLYEIDDIITDLTLAQRHTERAADKIDMT